MQEIELRGDRAPVEQGRESHAAGAAVYSGRHAECSRVRVDDATSQRVLGGCRQRRPKKSQGESNDGRARKRSHPVCHGDPPFIERLARQHRVAGKQESTSSCLLRQSIIDWIPVHDASFVYRNPVTMNDRALSFETRRQFMPSG